MDSADPRTAIAHAAQARGVSLMELSRLIGRNPAYIQQFVERGTPRRLAEGDRATLARYLGIAETLLGAPPVREWVAVPRIDATASAGPGGVLGDDAADGFHRLDADLLRELRVRPADASMIAVRGDSMEPSLGEGDVILVDRGDRRGQSGRIHVVRHDGLLLVKRLARVAHGVELVSDNSAYPPIALSGTPDIVGRVVWLSRRL